MSDSDSDVPRDPVTHRPLNPRRILFEPVIGRVVDALGGYEAGVYRMGDEASGCLKDLKKLWRKDDDDDERTIARIFYEKRVLANDLVPILLLTAGAGQVEDKRAVSAADLISAMTWPIDVAEELAELEPGERADFGQLQEAHRQYKAALLQPAVMAALFAILLPPLAKAPRERSLRDNQVAALVLHIIRNLAAIRDRDGLQSKLLRALEETHTTDLMLTIATNAESDPLLGSWNTLILEIMFFLFRGTPPATLNEQPKTRLRNLLAEEARAAPTPVSRHSRFGTTIVVMAKPAKKPADYNDEDDPKKHNAAKALVHKTGATSSLLDAGKRAQRVRAAPAIEASLADDLNTEAREVLRNFARTMLDEGIFDRFLTALFKDIRMERAWATGTRIPMWVMAVVRWMLGLFLLESKDSKSKRQYGLVAAAADSGFVSFVLRHMREATEEKPKGWPMLYAGMGCLTQILLLLDNISASATSDDDPDAEAAQTLRTQMIYAGLPLDLALECLKSCTATNADGRGPAFLDAAVTFAYSMVRMVERAGNEGDSTYVRRRKTGKKHAGDGEDAHDAEEDERRRRKKQADGEKEQTFSLEAFEMRFASSDVTKPLLLQLARFKEMHSNPEALRRVVGLLHRVAVRGKAEGFFFNVSTLQLFQAILAAQKTFPRDQPHKDLVALVNFILRKFFKALEEEPFLAVEAFFPKNRGQWKAFSSWEAPEKEAKQKGRKSRPVTAELKVKGRMGWSEQLGIAVAALIEAGQASLITWTVALIETMLREWRKVFEALEADKNAENAEQEDDDDALLEKRMAEKLEAPSVEMLSKMQDYLIPYTDDNEAKAATENPHLKLLFRLAKFAQMDDVDGEIEAQWIIPKTVPPADLQRTVKVIEQYLATPFNLEGKKASEYLTKARPAARRREPSVSSASSSSDSGSEGPASADSDGEGEDDAEKKARKEKKRAEREQKRAEREKKREEREARKRERKEAKARPPKPAVEYKSAQFIEDSDEEYGAMDEFLVREKEMRERIEQRATETGKSAGMRETGTKKRKKKGGGDNSGSRKKRKSAAKESDAEESDDGQAPDGSGSTTGNDGEPSPPRPRPRPKPKARLGQKDAIIADVEEDQPAPPRTSSLQAAPVADDPDSDSDVVVADAGTRRRKNRLVVSDDDDD